MRYDVAPCRLLIWLGAALVGWAVLIGLFVYVPQALAGFALAGVLLWRKGQRPVHLVVLADEPAPATAGPTDVATPDAAALVRIPDDVRELMAHPV